MDTKQVIEQLEDLREHSKELADTRDLHNIWEDDVQALNKAIEALEKEMPEKPHIEKKIAYIERYGEYVEPEEYLVKKCCACGSDVEFSYLYCPYCGQKLDWEVLE